MGDPAVDGLEWAKRQEGAFGGWVVQYGGGDQSLWDFGLESLDRLTYILFHRFPTLEHVDDPANEAFTEGAAWYLGEIVRRSDPTKRRWSNRATGTTSGEYIVEHTAKTRVGDYVVPGAHLRSAIRTGDPLFLRAWYANYVVALWDKPWPAWIHETQTGAWTWDSATARWLCQRDQWREGIYGLLDGLETALPSVELDFSTASLQQVEQLLLADPESPLRDAIVAYLGECLLRAVGGRWVWNDRPDSVTHGFPVVDRGSSVGRISPAHVVEYARAWRDGDTLARVHRAALVRRESERGSGRGVGREGTPGLDGPVSADRAELWAAEVEQRFGEWVARYGAGVEWDFSVESLDALAQIVVAQCPAGVYLLDGPAGVDFTEGAVWYFGETLRRAKPSRWAWRPRTDADGKPVAGGSDRVIPGMTIATSVTHDSSLGVFLVQDLDGVARRTRWSPSLPAPATDPEKLRAVYDMWIAGPVRGRIEESLKRRRRVRRRVRVRLSDREFLAQWHTEQAEGFPTWVQRYGGEVGWDFSLDSLDALEALVWQVAGGPEDLLEHRANDDFVAGATWYLGEVLLRHGPADARWVYEREGNNADPFVAGMLGAEPIEELARIYTDARRRGGTLRRRHAAILAALPRDGAESEADGG